MNDKRYDKILGCLVAAATGDAMGCPLETRPVELIKRDFGNGDFVYDYMETLPDSIAKDMPRAWVTDDFSVAYISAKYFLRDGGKITEQNCKEAVLDWCSNEDTKIFFDMYGGPSTRKAIAIINGETVRTDRDYLFSDNLTGTNGGGMKAWMVGLFDQNNVDKAIEDALTMCRVTHSAPVSLAGGAAIAAAVSAAFAPDATLDSVLDAGEYGARIGLKRGYEIGRMGTAASIERRIQLARCIAKKYGDDFERCVVEMTDLIGTGLRANEAVPSAFGFFAAGGDVLRTVYMAINSGNDCDTTAIMASSMAGAFYGASNMKNFDYHFDTLQRENKWIDFKKMADDIYEITK